LSNAADSNQVTGYLRASNGNLSRDGSYATTGKGLGAGTGSQGALVFDAKSQRFFAVNAGDNTISMLAIDDATGALTALSTVASGGKQPASITVSGDAVYVLNQGDAKAGQAGENISGFKIAGDVLAPIDGSAQSLSATTNVLPTDIAFTPDGGFLVVAERMANKLDTFKVVNGMAQAGNFQASAGQQPFAVAFSPDGFLVVAEVGDGSMTGSTASSYTISNTGVLTPVTSKLPTLQGAACWIVIEGDFAYLSNTASANITGLTVSVTGALTLHDKNGITAVAGKASTDLALSPDHGFLYALSAGDHTIHTYSIEPDGGLTALPVLPNVPEAAVGLVAR
jgi:6-phosphogluconolactonase (cycloisomerase 2 family)